jgi:Tripartite tricarboxylate transporter family receptor
MWSIRCTRLCDRRVARPSFVFSRTAASESTPAASARCIHGRCSAKSVKELIAIAKVRPGKLTHASSSPGSAGHLAGEMMKIMAGIDMVTVNYKGSAPALVDLISGHGWVEGLVRPFILRLRCAKFILSQPFILRLRFTTLRTNGEMNGAVEGLRTNGEMNGVVEGLSTNGI